jgi:hypothetical protein
MMEPNDVLTLRETWAAECHADAPKGACCCCYRTNHHQHQVKTESLQAENARLTEQLRIATETLGYLSRGAGHGKSARHMSTMAEDALIQMSVVE